MRFVLLHYHFFKNAGSTIEDILGHSFGARFGKLETPIGGGVISNTELISFLDARPELRAFSSHQIRHPLPDAPGYLFFDICFLRDPIDRLRSFYDYFRQKPNPADPMSELANGCNPGGFVEAMIRDFPLFVRNNQVNLLACGGDSDEPDERDLELAVRRMKATSFLGVVDCFGQSVAAGRDVLRYAFPELDCARAAVNVSGGLDGTVASRTAALREACRPAVFEELLRITALDRQLVDQARADVLRRDQRVISRAPRLKVLPKTNPREKVNFLAAIKRFASLAPFWRELASSARAALFDKEYYGGSLIDFLMRGAYEGRQPHPLFDPAFYLRKYPDVANSGVNPWCHYLKYGREEMRQPHPLFDPGFYLTHSRDVREARLNPLLHYVCNGAAEDRKPHPLFGPNHYRAACPVAPRDGSGLLAHFLKCGAGAANPHPLFDCEAYVDAHPEVWEKGLNPLVHYVNSASEKAPEVDNPYVELDIQDVRLMVLPVNSERDISRNFEVGVAFVWQDQDGSTRWIAEPQQLPFLRAVRVDQIRAQMNPSRGPYAISG